MRLDRQDILVEESHRLSRNATALRSICIQDARGPSNHGLRCIPGQWEQDAVFSDLQPGKPLLARAAMTLYVVGFGCAWAHSTRIGLLYKKFSGQHDCRCVNTKARRAWLRVSLRALTAQKTPSNLSLVRCFFTLCAALLASPASAHTI